LSHHHSHLTSAVKVIQTHKKGEPLVHHLKRFFAADKKYGSKDRKQITSLSYNFYRLGKALKNNSVEDRIAIATFLCNNKSNSFLQEINPILNDKITLGKEAKISFLNIDMADIFPFQNEIGEGVEKEKYAFSFLKQPLFFLRIRPGKEGMVLEKLTKNNVDFEEVTTSCIALPQGFKTDLYFDPNKEVVVQDRNSQQVFNYLQKSDVYLEKDVEVWDCCAASGGKSILLHDILHEHVKLNVSDIRPNILNNLRIRFKDAGIKKYDSFTANLLEEQTTSHSNKYDLIVCDAPCTGSGTWSRTPEQTYFFDAVKIDEYAAMQIKIAGNAIKYLKKDGLFFYITCSVFKKENEDVVATLKQKFHLQVLQMEYLKGYEMQADTMFVAVLSF